LVGKPGRKTSLERPRHRWQENTEVHLGGDWINLAQDRDKWRADVNTVTNLQAA
jgi:hypothetical protein